MRAWSSHSTRIHFARLRAYVSACLCVFACQSFGALHLRVLQTFAAQREPESACNSADIPALRVRACQSGS
eukprot:1653284-Alexandrium_andersonii.AAC.1